MLAPIVGKDFEQKFFLGFVLGVLEGLINRGSFRFSIFTPSFPGHFASGCTGTVEGIETQITDNKEDIETQDIEENIRKMKLRKTLRHKTLTLRKRNEGQRRRGGPRGKNGELG